MSNKQWRNWHLRTDEDGIIWLHFDKAGSSTNVFSSDVFVEFLEILDQLSEIKKVIVKEGLSVVLSEEFYDITHFGNQV